MPSPKLDQSTNGLKNLPCERTKSDCSSDAAYIDLPPDSFWVPKENEKDWFDRNAIIQRTSSRKLSFSGCPTPHFHQENFTPQRSSLSFNHTSSKTPFIGLPMGHQKPCFSGLHQRHSKAVGSTHTTAYFQRNWSDPGSKSPMKVTEPASPQVNCLGRVGTKKEKVKNTGLWQTIATVFKTGFKSHSISSSSSVSNCNSVVNNEEPGPVEEKSQKPSLAGLMRLRSGRRSSGIIELKGE